SRVRRSRGRPHGGRRAGARHAQAPTHWKRLGAGAPSCPLPGAHRPRPPPRASRSAATTPPRSLVGLELIADAVATDHSRSSHRDRAADPFAQAYAELGSCREMDVLVTGATGFVGANVARLLI